MSQTGRSVLTATRKRKDREDPLFYNRGNFVNPPPPSLKHNTTSSNPIPLPSNNSNKLLAGYMAYEFLTRGTLFGQKFDPSRAEAVPLAAAASSDSKRRPGHSGSGPDPVQPNRSYAEVAHLLKGDGAHIPGVVNPTQLAKWIQM